MDKEKASILIIDDESDMQETLSSILKKFFTPETASSGKEGLRKIRDHEFSLVLLDLKMPEMDGIATLRKIKEVDPLLPVIMVTASRDIKSAVDAMKLGAEDFINKPFEVEELLAVIEKAFEKRNLLRENTALKEVINDSDHFFDFIGTSTHIIKIKGMIGNIAPTNSTIMITGESGTGKEIAAKSIHKLSHRKNRPFIALNCAAIPENLLESELFGHERGAFTGAMDRRIGKFELADQGTLFLDEIGCMSPGMQSKLLRVLEDKQITRVGGSSVIKIDARIISATNIDFRRSIEEKTFREDLYYRLNVIPIHIPPLREREGDLVLLIEHFLHIFNRTLNKKITGFDRSSMAKLKAYAFPGNIRELKNIIERAVVLCQGSQITNEDLMGLTINAGNRKSIKR